MDRILKGLVGLLGVLMLLAWLRVTFTPMAVLENFGLQAVGPMALGAIRSFAGGYTFTVVVFCFLAIFKSEKQWLLVPVCLYAGSAINRSIGLLVDGFNPGMVGPIVVELVFITILTAAYRTLPSD